MPLVGHNPNAVQGPQRDRGEVGQMDHLSSKHISEKSILFLGLKSIRM